MLPCPVTPWASADPPDSCGSHGPPAQASQPLPDLLCSCPPAPQAPAPADTPSPDPMESIIVVTDYESGGSPAGTEEEEVGGC